MTDVGALTNTWATDPAVLERVLTRLRQWGREEIPHVCQRTASAGCQQSDYPVFGVTCRRASSTDPPIDITMPSSRDWSPGGLPTAAVSAAGRTQHPDQRKRVLMAKHRLEPDTTGRRRPVRTLDLVDVRDGLIHLLTPDALAAGLRPQTDYVALCGAVVLPAPLVEPGGRACWGCKSATVASVPSQRSR